MSGCLGRAPPSAGITSLILSVPAYGFLKWQFGSIAFLNRMAITFVLLLIVMAVITALKPLKEPKVMPVNKDFDMRSSPALKGLCVLVIAITLVLYIIFW